MENGFPPILLISKDMRKRGGRRKKPEAKQAETKGPKAKQSKEPDIKGIEPRRGSSKGYFIKKSAGSPADEYQRGSPQKEPTKTKRKDKRRRAIICFWLPQGRGANQTRTKQKPEKRKQAKIMK